MKCVKCSKPISKDKYVIVWEGEMCLDCDREENSSELEQERKSNA